MASYSLFPFADGPVTFDERDLGSVQPGLAAVKGFQLSEEELKDIFDIDKARFGDLPKRLVIPELHGEHYTENWYRVKGWLYQVEPVEWVPVVISEGTIPKSAFTTEYTRKEVEKSEKSFNASTSASLTIEGGGSYYGITADVKSENTVSFEVKKSRYLEEQWETKGTTGEVPIHKLFVYPLLRCRIVKRQDIEYTVNNSSTELKWTRDRDQGHCVGSGRLSRVRKLQFNPVPMTGWAVNGKTHILPVPKVENGVFSVTTLMSRTEWTDWYVYDAPNADWEDVHKGTMDFSAPNSGTAFGPMYTVVPLQQRPVTAV